jgi:hypothetical protein
MAGLVAFGIHKGKPFSQVPYDYLLWCVQNIQDRKRRVLMQVELERRDRLRAYRAGEPDPTKPLPVKPKQTHVKPVIPQTSIDALTASKFANVARAKELGVNGQVEITADECPY